MSKLHKKLYKYTKYTEFCITEILKKYERHHYKLMADFDRYGIHNQNVSKYILPRKSRINDNVLGVKQIKCTLNKVQSAYSEEVIKNGGKCVPVNTHTNRHLLFKITME